MSNRHIPRRYGGTPRIVIRPKKLRTKLSRTLGQPQIIDLGDGYRAIMKTRRDVLWNGKRTTRPPALTIRNDNKDRTLTGKQRRLARKNAQRDA